MKEKNTFLFIILISFQFLFNFKIIKSFGIEDAGEHLLIYFLKESKKKDTEILSEEDYMKDLMYNELYTNFNIGIPNQYLKFYYEMNNYKSYISEDSYFKARSTSYKLIDSKYQNISLENNKFEIKDPNGYLSKEHFELGKDKALENFTFLLKPSTKNGNIKNKNSIGLCFNKKNDSLSLLSELKEKKYIKQKVFSFLIGDDSFAENKMFDGQVLIGCFPHDVNFYYDEEGLNYISVNNTESEKWNIKFDSIKYKEDELKNKIAELDINLNVIIGPENFRKKLNNSFFRDFIENKKCKESYFTNEKDGEKYLFYSFDNDIQFKEIPELSFYSKELNETFKISFSNLFSKYRQRYYFHIIFKKRPDNKWVLGQSFLNAYKFVFDLEERKIGYYKSYSNKNHPLIVIICVVVFAAIFIIGYWKGNSMKNSDANLYGNNKMPLYVRKEYADDPTDSGKDKNLVNNKKEESPKPMDKKEVKKEDKVGEEKVKKD